MRPLAHALLLLLLAGCSPRSSPELYGTDAPGLDLLIDESQARAAENVRVTELGRAEHMSIHLVSIRDREQPHVHTRYDLSVTLVRGSGVLHLGAAALPMSSGDSAFIARGTPHYFVNRGDVPAAALVVFAPPFEGPDQAPVVPAR